MTIELERRGDVSILRWNDGENRFGATSVARWHDLLDELARIEGPQALVVTGSGKYFSNGLDLAAIMAEPEHAAAILDGVHRIFGRLLLFPAYTVAAINGHAYAAGAMLSAAFDRRVMRADRGYWCLPEVDLGLPLTPGMHAVVTARLPQPAAAEAMITGRRYTSAEALDAGIVDELASETDLLELAVNRAAAMAGKHRSVIATHKRQLFGAAAAVLGVEG
jgi:Delta3-Delta2-enoyl-CoA isomerase